MPAGDGFDLGTERPDVGPALDGVDRERAHRDIGEGHTPQRIAEGNGIRHLAADELRHDGVERPIAKERLPVIASQSNTGAKHIGRLTEHIAEQSFRGNVTRHLRVRVAPSLQCACNTGTRRPSPSRPTKILLGAISP